MFDAVYTGFVPDEYAIDFDEFKRRFSLDECG